jgi:hypothetical protein
LSDRWEYKVYVWNDQITPSDENKVQEILNDFGRDGWKLVNIIPQVVTSNHEEAQEISVGFNVFVFRKKAMV